MSEWIGRLIAMLFGYVLAFFFIKNENLKQMDLLKNEAKHTFQQYTHFKDLAQRLTNENLRLREEVSSLRSEMVVLKPPKPGG